MHMRQLLTTLLAAGLTAGIVAAASKGSVGIGPDGKFQVLAGAGEGVAASGAAVTAPPSYQGPPVVPIAPSKLDSRGSGFGPEQKPEPKAPDKATNKPPERTPASEPPESKENKSAAEQRPIETVPPTPVAVDDPQRGVKLLLKWLDREINVGLADFSAKTKDTRESAY